MLYFKIFKTYNVCIVDQNHSQKWFPEEENEADR